MPSQTAVVRKMLENAIIEGRLPPGAQLDPNALSKEYGCSRTPVREALQQLSVSGLVTVKPKRGSFVTWLTVEEMTERFELMAEIESVCGRLAARRITQAEIDALYQCHRECEEFAEADDADGYYAANSNFHHIIYKATHNRALAEEAAKLHSTLQPYRRRQLQYKNRLRRSYAEHEEIIAAIAGGKGDEAAALLHQHVIIQGDRFHDLIASLRGAQPAEKSRESGENSNRP